MKTLIGVAAAALTLTGATANGAEARTQARVLVTVAPQGAPAAPAAVAAGRHTIVLRNRSNAARRLRIVRVHALHRSCASRARSSCQRRAA